MEVRKKAVCIRYNWYPTLFCLSSSSESKSFTTHQLRRGRGRKKERKRDGKEIEVYLDQGSWLIFNTVSAKTFSFSHSLEFYSVRRTCSPLHAPSSMVLVHSLSVASSSLPSSIHPLHSLPVLISPVESNQISSRIIIIS